MILPKIAVNGVTIRAVRDFSHNGRAAAYNAHLVQNYLIQNSSKIKDAGVRYATIVDSAPASLVIDGCEMLQNTGCVTVKYYANKILAALGIGGTKGKFGLEEISKIIKN